MAKVHKYIQTSDKHHAIRYVHKTVDIAIQNVQSTLKNDSPISRPCRNRSRMSEPGLLIAFHFLTVLILIS